jgi:hypothetical protein
MAGAVFVAKANLKEVQQKTITIRKEMAAIFLCMI